MEHNNDNWGFEMAQIVLKLYLEIYENFKTKINPSSIQLMSFQASFSTPECPNKISSGVNLDKSTNISQFLATISSFLKERKVPNLKKVLDISVEARLIATVHNQNS